MKHTQTIATIMIMTLPSLFGCQPPSEPASLKAKDTNIVPNDTGENPKPPGEEANPKTPPVAIEFFAGGADIGTPVMKTAVKACLDQKLFYDRQKNGCTKLPLANVGCTIDKDKIKASMTEGNYNSFKTLVSDTGALKGFTLDQCLDCPDPLANDVCKGNGANPPATKGMRLFLVKQENNAIAIQTVYVKSVTP